ncbi:MAG: hypothetical protein KJ964_07970 [Verrucomicrobia bacterium]|nr:hypothetical protein [Verrucomicrobiota bacterium]MBU1735000.1 hypothetical protein [Verrucomicrobiota bacterium]MBU1856273.1 hypothetical protein [Verrucomicrobiota bacterium]
MKLEYKRDFPEAQYFWRLFWEGKARRPAIAAVFPKQGCTPEKMPGFGAAFVNNMEQVVDQALACAETCDFVGEAVPYFILSLCSNLLAAFLGAKVEIAENKHCFDTRIIPFIDDIGNTDIRFRPESEMWKKMVAYIEIAKRKCDGKLIVGAPTLVGNLDALAAIRGTERLLLDLYDAPEAVHHALDQITTAYHAVFNEFKRLFEFDKYGSVTRHGLYCPGATNVPQCDFAYNIGKEHFNEFALPSLRREIEVWDGVEYHLDGVNSIIHLESLCTISKIGVIQWVPGVGHDNENWDHLYRRIDDLGKGQLRNVPAQLVSELWEQYQTHKLYCQASASSKSEVLDLIESFDT